jgi:hypothetical protein
MLVLRYKYLYDRVSQLNRYVGGHEEDVKTAKFHSANLRHKIEKTANLGKNTNQ